MRRGSRGTHRAALSGWARVAAAATVALLGLGGGALATGAAQASPSSPDVLVVGRLCDAGNPPGSIDEYKGSTGDSGRATTGRGYYAIRLSHVPSSGETITGAARCPGPRPTTYIRYVPFSFLVSRPARGSVVVHDIS